MIAENLHARHGFALIFVVATLALISSVAVALVAQTDLDKKISRQYVDLQRAHLAAESGIEYAFGRIAQLPGGPTPEAFTREFGQFEAVEPVSIIVEENAALQTAFSLRIADESGKLNLNDINARERLRDIVRVLIELAFPSRSAQSATMAANLFHHAQYGRRSYPGDRFPDEDALRRTLTSCGFTAAESDRLLDYVTLYAWRNPHTLSPNAKIYGTNVFSEVKEGRDSNGVALTSQVGRTMSSWLEFQSTGLQLEPRSPVNLNAARRELIQALLEPIEGVFLEEGPADWQSSEHYGWWSTGLGTPDPNRDKFGVIRRTRKLGRNQAALLAGAMYNRIHGIFDATLDPRQQPDRDGDGMVDPNPFETWEEFRHFLQDGLSRVPVNHDDAIFIGAGFNVVESADYPRPYGDFINPHNRALISADALTAITGVPEGGDNELLNIRYTWDVPARRCQPTGLSLGWNWSDSRIVPWRNRYLAQAQRDMLYANFNPNSLLNDFNPDKNRYLLVDKAQLMANTAEFGFAPTGYFRVESRGALTHRDTGVALAERTITAVAKCFERLHVTSEAQFLGGAGDMEEIRRRISKAEPVQRSGVEMTLRFDAHAVQDAPLTLQAYPEAVIPGNGERLAAARFDGCLAPAALETPVSQIVEQGFALNFNGETEKPLGFNWLAGPGTDPETVEHASNLTSMDPIFAAAGKRPGNLLPDGIYCEKNRGFGFLMSNFDADPVNRGLRGTLAFWIKPNFHTGLSSRIRKIVSGPSRSGRYAKQQMTTLYFMPNAGSDQVNGFANPSGAHVIGNLYCAQWRNYWTPTHSLLFGFAWQNPGDRYSFLEGNAFSRSMTNDFPHGAACNFGSVDRKHLNHMLGHQWSHMVLSWELLGLGDFRNLVAAKQVRMCVNGASTNRGTPATAAYLYPGADVMGARGTTCRTYTSIGYDDRPHEWDYYNVDFRGEWIRFGELPAETALARPMPQLPPPPLPEPDPDEEVYSETLNLEERMNDGVLSSPAASDVVAPRFVSSPAVAYDRAPSPYYADSTLDEIVGTGVMLQTYPLENSVIVRNLNQTYAAGRYYNGMDSMSGGEQPGMFTSPAIDLSRELGVRVPLTLHDVAWTCYRAVNNRAFDPSCWNDEVEDNVRGIVINANDTPDPMADFTPGSEEAGWDWLSVDVAEPRPAAEADAVAWWLENRGGVEQRLTYAGGSPLPATDAPRYQPGEVFRFNARFHLRADRPLYEAPALDDLTFTFLRSSPEILSWSVK